MPGEQENSETGRGVRRGERTGHLQEEGGRADERHSTEGADTVLYFNFI